MKHNQLGETVRSYRKGLGLTQQALAQQLGVEASHTPLSKVDAETLPSN